jgi:hypothetical protein
MNCSQGQNNDSTCSGTATTATWQQALQYCNSLTLASKSWRLPSFNELKSLVKYSAYSPPIDMVSSYGFKRLLVCYYLR